LRSVAAARNLIRSDKAKKPPSYEDGFFSLYHTIWQRKVLAGIDATFHIVSMTRLYKKLQRNKI